MKTRIGINGFGRIGRSTFKIINEKYSDTLDVVAINDLTDAKTLTHLLKYDSLYGIYEKDVDYNENSLIVNGKETKIISEKSLSNIEWNKYDVDIVLESTGLFTKRDQAKLHIEKGGAKKVIISAPATDEDITLIIGVNENLYDNEKHHIISNSSCTTNCLAPLAKLLNDNYIIKKGLMTTVHSYTNDQRILDLTHDDLRRARAANLSIVPTKTGAAKSIGRIIPELSGKLNGFSLRVPTPTVSVLDLVVETGKNVSKDEINRFFETAANGEMKSILGYSEEPLVSVDYKKCELSAVIDALSTIVVEDNLLKVIAWYDNEWGYCSRYADLAFYISKRMN